MPQQQVDINAPAVQLIAREEAQPVYQEQTPGGNRNPRGMEGLICSPTATLLLPACACCHGIPEAISPCPLSNIARICTRRAGIHLITGANRGVGFSTAKALLNQGCTVLLLCRDTALGERARAKLSLVTGNDHVEVQALDLRDFRSIETFCSRFDRAHTIASLVLNAGTICEGAMQVNHVGHMALCVGLLDVLVASRSTVVSVASCAHWLADEWRLQHRLLMAVRASGGSGDGSGNDGARRPSSWEEYCDSKAANVLFVQALQRRVGRFGVQAVAYHPGVMATDLWRSHRLPCEACACCAKHPHVSGGGAAALANPRCCRLRSPAAAVLCGEGGYYQQACCMTLFPVRPRPAVSSHSLQDELWVATLSEICKRAPHLAAICHQKEGMAGVLANPPDTKQLRSPACPWTEPCSKVPNCVCLSCLC
jgi:retinol dehydrogenase-12